MTFDEYIGAGGVTTWYPSQGTPPVPPLNYYWQTYYRDGVISCFKLLEVAKSCGC